MTIATHNSMRSIAAAAVIGASFIRAQAVTRTLIFAQHLNPLHVADEAAKRFAALVAGISFSKFLSGLTPFTYAWLVAVMFVAFNPWTVTLLPRLLF